MFERYTDRARRVVVLAEEEGWPNPIGDDNGDEHQYSESFDW